MIKKQSFGATEVSLPWKQSSNQISMASKVPMRKAIFYGRGLTEEELTSKPKITDQTQKYKTYRAYFDKVYVDKKKLAQNILFCKYIHNNTNIPRLKTQTISNDLRDLITDVLNENYHKKLYESLNGSDKKIFRTFNKCFKFDLELPDDNEDKEFKERFNILVGSYYSGNDSNELKTELKKYVRLAVAQGLISQTDALSLLVELTN
jgi:hypothetical protein